MTIFAKLEPRQLLLVHQMLEALKDAAGTCHYMTAKAPRAGCDCWACENTTSATALANELTMCECGRLAVHCEAMQFGGDKHCDC